MQKMNIGKFSNVLLLSVGMCFSGNVFAVENNIVETAEIAQQRKTISGTVEDDMGPVAGATVVVKGTTNGTITDIDGKFSIEASEGQTIVISFIGYNAQEIKVTSQTSTLKIDLKEDSQALDEVVVTALGIKRDRKALGYSVSSVKSEDITNAGTPMNAMQALYGKTSGLQLASTNAGPTGGMNIKVRNAVSLNENSSTRPLIVVDGIPIHDENTKQDRSSVNGADHGTGLNDINPEDIESIEILKGAKAAVLYGSEGANGVMLITTKTGKKRGLGIDFGVNHSWNKAAYYADVQNEFGSGSSLGAAALDNVSKDGFYMRKDPSGQMVESLWEGASGNFGRPLDGRKLLWFDDTYHNYSARKNNMTDMYRTGMQTNVNVAVSNGGDLGSFRLSYNYRDYQSVAVGGENKSHSFNFSSDLKANDWVKIKMNTSYVNTRDINAPYAIQDLNTYGLPREMDVKYIKNTLRTSEGYNTYASPVIGNRSRHAGTVAEYYWSQLVNENEYTRNHFIQSMNIDVTLNDKFSWNSLGGLDYTVVEHEVKNHIGRPLSEEALQGYYGMRNIRTTIFYGQSTFNYNQTFNDVWDLSAMFGGAVKRNQQDNQNQYIKETFAIENWFSMNNTREVTGPRSDRSRGKDLLLSLFGSVQLAYDNQLYLEFQARNDWSSILPPGNNHYFYPGVSASWIFTETFDIPGMTFGKLRASWADVGRPGPRYYGNVSFNLGSYGGTPTMGFEDYLPPADFAGSTGGFPLPNLKPEKKKEYEFGFETSFLPGNRINVDFSYFHSNTYNQIVTLPVPSSSGVKEVRVNAGDIAQDGIEFSINTKPIMTKDFTWTLGLNLAHYSTKIKKLDKGIMKQELWGGTGCQIMAPVNGQYGEIWVRPYKTDEQGNKIVGSNGVWEVNNEEYKKVGKITPDVIGGLTTGLTYKNVSLNATVDFQFGATLVSQTNMYLLGNGLSKKSLKYRDEARGGLPYYLNGKGDRIPLESHNAAVPADSHYPFILHDGVILNGKLADGTQNTNLITAEQYYTRLYWQSNSSLLEDQVYKSDYISMRSLSVSYSLPKKVIAKLKVVNDVRFNVFGNNLFYIYKNIPNVTPESAGGTNSYTEFSTMPGLRSFGLGANVSF